MWRLRGMAWLMTLMMVLALGVMTGGAQGSRTRGVQVAAAADLKFALDEILEAFHARHADINAQVTYGSSGNFFAQLSNRAP